MASIYDWNVVAGSNSSADAGIAWPEGMAPGLVNDSARAMMGRVAEILGDLGGALSAGGTANGLTVTANSAFTTLAEGRLISFRATASNSGAATLNVNGIGAKSIRKMTATGDSAIAAGDIQNTGIYVAQYSGALNAAAGGWLLVNPTLSSLSLLDLTLVSTDAGASAAPVFTRYRNSASPLASDIIAKDLDQGEDSAGNTEDYAERYTTITDPTSGSEDADYLIRTKVAGTMTTHATFGGVAGVLFPIVDINGGAIDGTVIGAAVAAPINGTIGTFSTRTLVPSGTAGSPSMGFTPSGDSGNGFYKSGLNEIGISVAGTFAGEFSTGDGGSGKTFHWGKANWNSATTGISMEDVGFIEVVRSSNAGLRVARIATDGTLVLFEQDGVNEGSISVIGTTVSYNAILASHWAQPADGSRPAILRGTICETIDQLCEWPGETNDRLPRFKVSDTPGSKSVYGFFLGWDDDDDRTNDAYIAAVGAGWLRIAAGVTVERGDLIESNGDGCGRVQADALMRASTVGKVSSATIVATYSDGSYLVPCTIHCG